MPAELGGHAVITGGRGFLGWHLSCRLRALSNVEVTILGSGELGSLHRAAEVLASADVVFHIAGVNRGSDAAVLDGNVAAAQQLVAGLTAAKARPSVVYASSVHAAGSTAYGRGKGLAGELLVGWAAGAGTSCAEVRLPNVFGEHGRPHYNSVVATFSHLLATGDEPTVESDAEIQLLHAQQAADALISAVGSSGLSTPGGTPRRVTWLRDRLSDLARTYRSGDIPDVTSPFDRDLFNTYRSHCFPDAYPMPRQLHVDQRGALLECVRAHGGQGQTFVSSSHPGAVRGEHFHLHKIERFLVLAGEAQIALRRLFDDTVFRFDVAGDIPVFIDMPTMWAHSITNTGDGELTTLFWTADLFNPTQPDTYPERVAPKKTVAA